MKPEYLSDAMNHLDDELVEEARASRQEKSPDSRPAPRKTGQKHWQRLAAAACFALCIGGAALLWQGGWGAGQPLPIDPASVPQEGSGPESVSVPQQSQTPENSTPRIGPGGLPMLTITEDTSGGMGFEGYMAYDISELVSANPWTPDAGLSTLPVYRNTLKSAVGDDFLPGQPYPVTEELSGKMRAFLLEVAGRLGLDAETLEITDDSPSEEYKAAIREKYAAVGDEEPPEELFAPTQLQAEQNGIRLEIRPNMTVTIWYDTPVSLPAGYAFGYYNMSYEQAQASAEYLLQQYRNLIAMQNPRINVFMGDYNIYAQQSYSVSFFEGAGSLTEQIVNYNFNQIQFYNGEEDAFDLVRIFGPDLSDKIGDYPIITAEDAKELLLQGHYITTVPYEMPGEEWVCKAELIYRSGMYEEIYMPYYRFYVELPEAKRDNGLKTYGAYYVPAVEGQYLTNMPLWNGSFN